MGVNEDESMRSGSIITRSPLEHPWWNEVGGRRARFGEGGATEEEGALA